MIGLHALHGERVSLLPFREAWANHYARWLADPYVQRMAGERPETPEQVCDRHRRWTQAPCFVEYIIIDRQRALPIGDVSLNAAEPPPKFGIMIGEPAFRGRRFAAEAATLLLDYARAQGWMRIVAEVYDHNELSLRFHQKLGFRLLEHDAAGGQWVLERALDACGP